ncbi:MAG: outer membrane beta-barrel protein [Myxococcota bacterium]|nr:outer membrane beta-barrel protein [Myxococcota bacterium]
MRSRWTAVLTAFALVALAPSFAAAESDVEAQLQSMQERLEQMEERLQATNDQLDAANTQVEEQAEMIERSGLLEARGDTSGLASFVNSVTLNGWVASSYFYNFNNPDGKAQGGANSGTSEPGAKLEDGPGGIVYPFHPDANSFSLDQVWFEIEKLANEEGRAGFRFDIAYGKTAGILSGNSGGSRGGAGTSSGGDLFSGNDFTVYQGYVQYLAPVGNGIDFKFGKFQTLIGAEVAGTVYNWNITRGNVYNLFQPFTHTGITAGYDFNENISFTIGAVNETRSFPAADVDFNKDKAVIGNLAFSGDTWSVALSGTHGEGDSGKGVGASACGSGGCAGDRETIVDVLLSWDPTEDLSLYVDYTYINTDDVPWSVGGQSGDKDVKGHGVSVAGRYSITDRTGIALRGEYLELDNFFGNGKGGGFEDDLELWGITATVDHLLTNNLMIRSEVRYDNGDDGRGDNLFINDDDFREDDQWTVGVEAVYNFNEFAM